jgi:flagellar motor switch protein FliM
VSLRPRVTGIEYNPKFAQAASVSDAMIVTSFEMRVGTVDCIATICLPFGPVFTKLQGEPGGPALSDSQRTARETALRNMTAGLHSAPVEVSVRFASIRMRPRDLVALRPGDIVPLDHSVTAPLAITSGGRAFAHAVPGSSGKRLACLVVPSPKEDD